jgi:RNA polymerase sigma factor (sigma-70 family)
MPRSTAIGASEREERRAAFDELYAQHLDAIVRYLRRRLGDQAAEDAAAEVFLRALRATPPLTDPEEALPWLYVTASHVISERRRSERRRLRAMERAAGQLVAAAEDRPVRPDIDPKLVRALRRLSTADREALLLIAWGELSYDEAAQVLKVPVGTVRSRIARARRQLDAKHPVPGTPVAAQITTGDR